MKYAELVIPEKEPRRISFEPTNFGSPYQQLFGQTDVSGSEVFQAYGHNNFDNQFQQADEQRYKDRGWWAEIFRDVVRAGSRGEVNGRLGLVYVSHAGIPELEKVHNVLAPKNGYWVPTNDGIFVPGTLIPFETVQDKKEATRRLESKGIPKEQVSYFYRLERYDSERFVGRSFGPDVDDGGRFVVDAGWHPSDSGDDGVASRPRYGEDEIVMRINVPEIASAA